MVEVVYFCGSEIEIYNQERFAIVRRRKRQTISSYEAEITGVVYGLRLAPVIWQNNLIERLNPYYRNFINTHLHYVDDIPRRGPRLRVVGRRISLISRRGRRTRFVVRGNRS